MGLRTSTTTKLLDAADELFFTRGVAATPIDAVLERAGVSAATMYRGFPSKDALVASALDRRHDDWLAVWDDAATAAPTARAALLSVFDALDAFRARPEGARWCAFLGTAAEYAEPPSAIAEALHRETATYLERLTGLAGAAGARDPDALARQLLLVVSGDLAMRLRDPQATSRTARDIAGVLVDGATRGT